MRWMIGLLALLLILPCVVSEDANVFLALKNVQTNQDLSGVIVSIETDSNKTRYYVSEEDILRLYLDPGSHRIGFIVDDPMTDAVDYANVETLHVGTSLVGSVYLEPVGGVRGIVKDSLGNMIPYADIKFNCQRDVIFWVPQSTDKYGMFQSELPIGSCMVTAKYKDAVGYMLVNISHGNMTEIEITLDKSVIGDETTRGIFLIPLMIVIVLLIMGIISWFLLFKRENSNSKSMNPNSQKLFESLNDRERLIIESLLASDGKNTQNKIFIETGIPKATLSRTLQGLQSKNIVEIIAAGKARTIKLTDWFMES